MGIQLPVADISQSSPAWFSTDAGNALWSAIAKTAPDSSGRFIQSTRANPVGWVINNADFFTVQMAAVAPPGVATGHSVVIEAWTLNPGLQTVQLQVIDGNTSAVLSTGTITVTQTPTLYTYALPSSDVSGNFNNGSYAKIYVTVTRNATTNPQDLYVDLLQFVTPNPTLDLGSVTMSAAGSVAGLFGYEVAVSTTMAGTSGLSASAAGGSPLLAAAMAGGSGLAALLTVEQGMAVTMAGNSGMSLSRPSLSPQARRDSFFPAPLGKLVSRRDR